MTFIIIATVLGFIALFTIDAVCRIIDFARPSIKHAAIASVKPTQPTPTKQATPPVALPTPQPVGLSDSRKLKPQSVGSAAINFDSMTRQELYAHCQSYPEKFAGYTAVYRKSKIAGLRNWMSQQ